MNTPLSLTRPTSILLSRVSDRLSFLYLDKARVEQDDNGTHARIETVKGSRSAYIPVADLTCILLGPGTTLTQAAASAISRAGCTASFVGSGAVRSYATFVPPTASTRLLEEQARIFSSDERRVEAAKLMLLKRFPEEGRAFLPTGASIEQLRGIEGARMKAIYRMHASRHRLHGWRRNRAGDFGEIDAVNIALNHANTALYGLVTGVVQALGTSPGLGFVHQGNRNSFVLDIADLYKAEMTIPLSFSLWKSADAGRDVMSALRKEFRLLRILPRIVDDIHEVLGIEAEESDWDENILNLWAPGGLAEAGVNHAPKGSPFDGV